MTTETSRIWFFKSLYGFTVSHMLYMIDCILKNSKISNIVIRIEMTQMQLKYDCEL